MLRDAREARRPSEKKVTNYSSGVAVAARRFHDDELDRTRTMFPSQVFALPGAH